MVWMEADGPELDACLTLDLLADEDEEAEAERGECPTPLPAIVAQWPALEPAPRLSLTPRPYQEEALTAWTEAGGRGGGVLPTGAGKTAVALLALAPLGVRTLIPL